MKQWLTPDAPQHAGAQLAALLLGVLLAVVLLLGVLVALPGVQALLDVLPLPEKSSFVSSNPPVVPSVPDDRNFLQ